MESQERMKAVLGKLAIPSKQIECYGSQIVITAWSRNAAEKWAMVLAKFSTVRGITKSIDYAKENTNTVLRPSTVSVWRVFARV